MEPPVYIPWQAAGSVLVGGACVVVGGVRGSVSLVGLGLAVGLAGVRTSGPRFTSGVTTAIAAGIAVVALARLGAHASPSGSVVGSLLGAAVALAALAVRWPVGALGGSLGGRRSEGEPSASSSPGTSRSAFSRGLRGGAPPRGLLGAGIVAGGALAAVAVPGAWWIDGVAGLALAAVIGQAGVVGWRDCGRTDYDADCGCGH